MIRAQPNLSLAELAGRLENRARELAQAHAERQALTRRPDSRRWRRAALLWPNFAKG